MLKHAVVILTLLLAQPSELSAQKMRSIPQDVVDRCRQEHKAHFHATA